MLILPSGIMPPKESLLSSSSVSEPALKASCKLILRSPIAGLTTIVVGDCENVFISVESDSINGSWIVSSVRPFILRANFAGVTVEYCELSEVVDAVDVCLMWEVCERVVLAEIAEDARCKPIRDLTAALALLALEVAAMAVLDAGRPKDEVVEATDAARLWVPDGADLVVAGGSKTPVITERAVLRPLV